MPSLALLVGFLLYLMESPVPGKAAGRAAVDLPWLCPQSDSLIGLAEDPASLARLSAADPAVLAFLVRFAPADPFSLAPERFLSPALLDGARAFLAATPDGWLSPRAARVVRSVADHAAAFARRLAVRSGTVSPENAAVAAALAPLGWYAVTAVDEYAFAECLADPAFRVHPRRTQEARWGLDHDTIARRLAARWRLPAWVGGIVGNLNLPLRAARTFVPDADLFAVVQLAVHEAQVGVADLGLTRSAERRELAAHLNLDGTEDLFRPPCVPIEPEGESGLDPNPHRVPLLPNLLKAAAESRRRNGAALVVRLEARIDELHRAVADLSAQDAARLRDAKLAGLAELAAGAGHEINNPLAVISGHAQRLARTEADPERADSLRTIVRQTQRIHGLLRDMMQFARPPRPDAKRFPACDLLSAIRDEFAPLTAPRDVRLDVATPPADVWLEADLKQVRHALTAVVRNAVEAVPSGGWVRVECVDLPGRVEFLVEDSGPGLGEGVAAHAFDPFYSGRSAGRGCGLGLSTAWQLARQNGGDVRHEPSPDGPTRFVVTVPRAANERSERLSA